MKTPEIRPEKGQDPIRLPGDGKRNWETCQCRPVAEEINKLRGTDYEPVNYKDVYPGEDFPDVLLRSTSGSYPELNVEVTSIPGDFLERDDKDSDRKIMQTLTESLSCKGVEHYHINVGLSREARAHGVRTALLTRLAELLFQAVCNGSGATNMRVSFGEIVRYSPELAEYVTDALLSRHQSIPGVTVDLGEAQILASDGRWIEEGIRKKLERYHDPRMVENVMLVLGVAAFVDIEQIIAFRAANPEESLPFSEIWIVTYYDRGVFCLKSSTHGPAERFGSPHR